MHLRKTRGPYIPIESDFLKTAAPLSVWARCLKEAERSPMLRFRVGATIFDNTGILGSGCSHPDVERCKIICSIHAEHHAMRACRHLDVEGAWIAIYTLNANGGSAWSSRPCYACASLLYKRGIERIIYLERMPNGSFIPRSEHPEELLAKNIILSGGFAKQMRILD